MTYESQTDPYFCPSVVNLSMPEEAGSVCVRNKLKINITSFVSSYSGFQAAYLRTYLRT